MRENRQLMEKPLLKGLIFSILDYLVGTNGPIVVRYVTQWLKDKV